MAAPGALAVLVILSTMNPATISPASPVASHAGNAVQRPKLTLHAPATVPAAVSPRLAPEHTSRIAREQDVDVTGPLN